MLALFLWPPSLAVFLEGKIYDSFLRSAPARPPSGNVTVVDFDEASLARLGQWPWPRYRVAQLLGKIREAGAISVGLDMVFAEPDRTSLRPLSGEIRRDLGVGIGLESVPPEALDTDRTLADILSTGPFALGYQFDFDSPRGASCVLHPLRAAVRSAPGEDAAANLFEAQGVICNLPVLARAAGSSGFFNVTPDADGILRRVPVVIRHKGVLYPSLALAVFLRGRGGDVILETGPEGDESMRIDGKVISLDRRGNLLVNYRGRRQTFPHLSAASLLDGTADPAALRGKMVIVGTTAAGLKEIRTTPLEAAQPGAEIHATVIDNLLAGDPVAQPRWAHGLQILLILLPGFLLTGLLARERALWGLVAIIPSIAGIWFGSWWLLVYRQIHLPPLIPAVTLATVFTLLTSLRFLQADREMRE